MDCNFTTPTKIESVLSAFGSTPPASIRAVTAWVEQVGIWNQRVDLTAARSVDELADLMVADAACLAAHIAEGRRVVDVGSGAGAPGLPLALIRPDLEVTLVEPLQKRAALLRMIKGRHPELRLHIVQGRGEAQRERYDVAISRATLPPPKWLALGARLADEVWLLLARQEPPSLQGWRAVVDESYSWPLTAAERRIVCYRRATPT